MLWHPLPLISASLYDVFFFVYEKRAFALLNFSLSFYQLSVECILKYVKYATGWNQLHALYREFFA